MATTQRNEDKTYDHGSVVVRIGGVLYEGIRTYSFTQKRERGYVHGQGRDRGPRAKTKGKVGVGEISFSVDRQDAERIREDLARRAGSSSYGDAVVPITIQVSEPGLPTRTDAFEGCSYLDEAGGSDETSVDPLVEDIKFDFLKLKRTNRTLGTR